MKELFVFWQFNGDNRCYCQLKCPECYGKDFRTFKHYWNGKVNQWEEAFTRLNRPIYFNFSYGEALLSHGFFQCVDMIGRHQDWTLNIITNLLAPTEIIQRLANTKLAKDGRLFINPCWHPEGVDNPVESWETFKQHLLILKAAKIPTHVMMVWFPPVIKDFQKYFEWLDKNDFRVGIRRFVHDSPWLKHRFLRHLPWVAGKAKLMNYTKAERGFIYAYTCQKVTKYGLDLASPKGKLCYAGVDMILVKHDGRVALCAGLYSKTDEIGNIFDKDFKLPTKATRCRSNLCGGDFGMFVLPDNEFGPLPESMWHDTFLSQMENIPQTSPVAYPCRNLMLKYLEDLKREQSAC